MEVGELVRRVRVGDRVIMNDIVGWIDAAAPTLGSNTTTIVNPTPVIARWALASRMPLNRIPTAQLSDGPRRWVIS